MRVLVTADLHLDHWGKADRDPLAAIGPAFPTLDALIIAGDLANDPLRHWPATLDRIGRLMDPRKVFVMPGNHDYYFWNLAGDGKLRAIVEAAGMNFAQKRVIEFGGVRFLCCTLWTDFALLGDRKRAMSAARRGLNDYLRIARDAEGFFATPEDTLAIHEDHLAWLTSEIEKSFSGRSIIVTHHCPSRRATGPIDEITPAFASDLDEWILRHRPDLWLFGHTHRHLRGRVGQTPVVDVSLGYPEDIRSGEELADILLRGLVDTDAPHLGVDEAGG